MKREKFKRKPRKDESTEAQFRGGIPCSSEEASVMEVERRRYIVRFYEIGNHSNGRDC